MKISVALAAYKGEKFIAAQLASILPQLGEDDEIIVSDDLPHGETEKAVLSLGDSRIKYIEGKGEGVCPNFENAMRHCTGDVIFLCDQDDVWLDGKVKTVMSLIESGSDLVLHDASLTDADLNITGPSFFAVHGKGTSFAGNLIRNNFVGCCMAFTRQVMLEALPLPENVPMHDWWIGLVALKKGYRVTVADTPLILWRRHGGNVTGAKTSALQKLRWRFDILSSLASVCHRKEQ